MKKLLAVLLSSIMLISAFSACAENSTNAVGAESSTIDPRYSPLGHEGKNGETIHLTVWSPESAIEIITKQCKQFCTDMQPYATIKIEVIPQGEADPASQLIKDANAAADVFGFASDSINKLVDAGALMEIAGEYKTFVEENNSQGSIEATKVNDKIYAFPETGDNSYCLFYDKRVVSEEQSKTLEGVLEACKAKNKKFVMDAGDGYYSCMFLFTGGVKTDGFEADGATQKFTKYDAKTASHTMMAFRELFAKYKDNFLNGYSTKVIDGFKSDTVGAGIDGSWDFSAAKDALGENAGFAVLPTINVDGEPRQIVNMFGYKLMGVNTASKYPYAALELAKYLTGEDCQKERAVDLNWGPSNLKVAESTLIKSDNALSTILAQSTNSVTQVGISASFWTPVATMGNILCDFSRDMTEKDFEELIKITIANVRDK